MALLDEAVEEKKFDTRMIERNLLRGVISEADVQSSIKNLPDDAENGSWVSIESLKNDGEELVSNGSNGAGALY